MAKQSKKKSLRQTAYDQIKQKILSCEYAPGMHLNEQQICDEVGGISRTPVREALGRLEQEGLLKVFPKKGIIISDFQFNDINRIYEVRLLLEPYALRRYGHKLDSEKLVRFAEIMADPSRIEAEYYHYYFYELDDQFHSFIMNSIKNPYLTDTYKNISNLNLRLRVLSGNLVKDRIAATFAEHLKIIVACQQEDWEGAAEAMEEHLHHSRLAAFQMISENEEVF